MQFFVHNFDILPFHWLLATKKTQRSCPLCKFSTFFACILDILIFAYPPTHENRQTFVINSLISQKKRKVKSIYQLSSILQIFLSFKRPNSGISHTTSANILLNIDSTTLRSIISNVVFIFPVVNVLHSLTNIRICSKNTP